MFSSSVMAYGGVSLMAGILAKQALTKTILGVASKTVVSGLTAVGYDPKNPATIVNAVTNLRDVGQLVFGTVDTNKQQQRADAQIINDPFAKAQPQEAPKTETADPFVAAPVTTVKEAPKTADPFASQVPDMTEVYQAREKFIENHNARMEELREMISKLSKETDTSDVTAQLDAISKDLDDLLKD